MTTAGSVTVRALRSGADGCLDDAVIGDLFAATLLLGRPLGYHLAAAHRYADLCLGWYLGPGRADAAVAVDEHGAIHGYALVCINGAHHARWVRWRSARLAARVLGGLLIGRVDRPSRRFYSDRLRDTMALWRGQRRTEAPAHAHLNVVTGSRSGSAALVLRNHIDERCRVAGITAWSGEINAVVGTRERALERLGLAVVHRDPNHTLSASTGHQVVRLTVHREVPAAAAAKPAVSTAAPSDHRHGLVAESPELTTL